MANQESSATGTPWLWRGRVARGRVTVLQGATDTGKTSLSLLLGQLVGWGEELPEIKRDLPGEGEEEIALMYTHLPTADARAWAGRMSALPLSSQLHINEPADLTLSKDGLAQLERVIQRYALADFLPALVIFDTLRDFLPAGVHVDEVLPSLKLLAQKYDCAVLITERTPSPDSVAAAEQGISSVLSLRSIAPSRYLLQHRYLSPDLGAPSNDLPITILG